MSEDLSPEARRVIRAIKDLVDAAIAEKERDDPDSMGTYHEEQELEIAMQDFVKLVKGDG